MRPTSIRRQPNVKLWPSASPGLRRLGALLIILHAKPALASSTGGLPWEGPLQKIEESITGPVAGYVALAAVAIAGGMLIFGGELNDFARRLVYVVLVAGILLGATSIVGLFGATGATIGMTETRLFDTARNSAPGAASMELGDV